MEQAQRDASSGRMAMFAIGVALALQVGSKSIREGLFLSSFSVVHLPKMMLTAALFAIPTALLVTHSMKRWEPRSVTPALFSLSALVILLEWLFAAEYPQVVAVLVYLHVSTGGAVLLSATWSLFNERFDPHTLKKLVGKLGAASTLGGLAGGALMERVAHAFGAQNGLLLMAALSVAAAFGTAQLAAKHWPAPRKSPDDAEPPRFSGYMWTLALLVLFATLVTTFADFALKQAAAHRFTNAEELVRFFAVFYTATSLVGFLLQLFASRRALETVGLGGTLAISPMAALSLGSLALVAPSLVTIGLMRGVDLALSASLFRSAYEPLFTPVPAGVKRASKALIDVVFDKGAEAIASGIVLLLTLGSPWLLTRAPLFLSVGFATAVAWLALRAQKGYVAELERSLRAGTVEIDAEEHYDAATKLTLSATATGIDRKRLMEEIAKLKRGAAPAEGPPNAAEPDLAEQAAADVRILLGRDSAATRALLSRPQLDPRYAGFIVPLLARDELARSAAEALSHMGSTALGILCEVLVDEHAPLVVRRRVPMVLCHFRGARAMEALTRALDSEERAIRSRSALALLKVLDGTAHPDPAHLLAKATREAARDAHDESSRDLVLTLLSASIGVAPVALVRHGLRSEDPRLRGTALEYLESLLPESARAALVHSLSKLSQVSSPKSTRSESALRAELHRTYDGTVPELRLDELEPGAD